MTTSPRLQYDDPRGAGTHHDGGTNIQHTSQPAAHQRRVGQRLQALRKQHRLSQAEAARAINVAKESLGNWENGRRQPHDANLRALANLYGVSPRYIETGREANAEADRATPDLLAVLNEHSQLLRKIDASVAILADRLEQPPRALPAQHEAAERMERLTEQLTQLLTASQQQRTPSAGASGDRPAARQRRR